ncbi:hypothetical protein B0H14DRAFT_2653378 [Mycena olivaceomarginata]|nr:hypothetical protein B0H14DRAFT_2653378 [Mycena olivaceomarginata]
MSDLHVLYSIQARYAVQSSIRRSLPDVPVQEPTFNKVVVVVALSGDLLTVVSSLTTVYLYMVTASNLRFPFSSGSYLFGQHWGETEYLSTQPWSIPGYIVGAHFVFGTGITGAAVQIFLVRMLYALHAFSFDLTKRWFWLPILGLFIMTGVVGAGITVGSLFLDSSIHARDALVKTVYRKSQQSETIYIIGTDLYLLTRHTLEVSLALRTKQ